MALNRGFAGNAFGQVTEALDYTSPYAPTAKTYHGIALVLNGNVIGRIQQWQREIYKRATKLVRELNNLTFGRPVDNVPGINNGYTISAQVAEMWNKEIEIQSGYTTRWTDLISQTAPIEAQEFWFRGAGPYEVWTYLGCWITDRDETQMSAEGDTIVMANLNMSFVSRFLTSSGA